MTVIIHGLAGVNSKQKINTIHVGVSIIKITAIANTYWLIKVWWSKTPCDKRKMNWYINGDITNFLTQD